MVAPLIFRFADGTVKSPATLEGRSEDEILAHGGDVRSRNGFSVVLDLGEAIYRMDLMPNATAKRGMVFESFEFPTPPQPCDDTHSQRRAVIIAHHQTGFFITRINTLVMNFHHEIRGRGWYA